MKRKHIPLGSALLALSISMASGQTIEEPKQPTGDSNGEVVSTIPFPISDGTPAPPVVKPEPPNFRVLKTISQRKYVERAPEMPGTPAAKGMITMTMNLVEDPGLPDPLPPALAYYPDDPEVQARLKELFKKFKKTEFLFVSATVWDHDRTILRIYPNGVAEAAVTAVSNLDFNHYSGFTSFRVTDRAGEYQDYNLMMGIGNASSRIFAKFARLTGHKFRPPEFPEMLDFSLGGPDFVVMEGPEDGKAAATLRRLHELYRIEGTRMEAAYHAREAAREKRKAYLIANPPKPEDVTINFWRRSGPSNLEKHLKGEETAQ
jgi:hypothetical protein